MQTAGLIEENRFRVLVADIDRDFVVLFYLPSRIDSTKLSGNRDVLT